MRSTRDKALFDFNGKLLDRYVFLLPVPLSRPGSRCAHRTLTPLYPRQRIYPATDRSTLRTLDAVWRFVPSVLFGSAFLSQFGSASLHSTDSVWPSRPPGGFLRLSMAILLSLIPSKTGVASLLLTFTFLDRNSRTLFRPDSTQRRRKASRSNLYLCKYRRFLDADD